MSVRALRASVTLYALLLFTPTGTLVVEPSPAVVGAGAVAGLLFGLAVALARDPTEWLTGWVLVAVPTLPGGWLLSLVVVPPPGAPWIRLGGTLAVLPAIAMVGLAHHIRTDRLLADAQTHVSFSARPAPTVRRHLKVAVGAVLGVSAVVSVGIPLAVGETPTVTNVVWFPALVPVWLSLFGDDGGRDVAVTSAGVRLERAVHEWDGFAAYERTEDALVLTRTAWYRSSLSFDTEDIDDPDAVVDALARHLPPA